METILGCAGFDRFLFSINCTECGRPFIFCWKSHRAFTVSESGRQVRLIWLHRTVSQIPCDGAASNWTINICVIDSVYSLQHLQLPQSSSGQKAASNCGWPKDTGLAFVLRSRTSQRNFSGWYVGPTGVSQYEGMREASYELGRSAHSLTHWGRGHLNCLNARSRGF